MSEYNVTKFYRMYIIPIKCKNHKAFYNVTFHAHKTFFNVTFKNVTFFNI